MALVDDFLADLTTVTRRHGIVLEALPEGQLVGRQLAQSRMRVYYGIGSPLFQILWRPDQVHYTYSVVPPKEAS